MTHSRAIISLKRVYSHVKHTRDMTHLYVCRDTFLCVYLVSVEIGEPALDSLEIVVWQFVRHAHDL